MEKNDSKIVSVYPTPLIITKQRNSNYYESKLNLTNLTNDYVLFKIYNNQHSLYSAKPSASYIPPKETAHVLIKRFSKDDGASKSRKELIIMKKLKKLLIQNCIMKIRSRKQCYM